MDVPHPALLKTFLLLGNSVGIKGSVEHSVPHLVVARRLLTSKIRNTKAGALQRGQIPLMVFLSHEEEAVFQSASCSGFHSQLHVL